MHIVKMRVIGGSGTSVGFRFVATGKGETVGVRTGVGIIGRGVLLGIQEDRKMNKIIMIDL
jgi:hypothetical protein